MAGSGTFRAGQWVNEACPHPSPAAKPGSILVLVSARRKNGGRREGARRESPGEFLFRPTAERSRLVETPQNVRALPADNVVFPPRPRTEPTRAELRIPLQYSAI
ncbi:hypothetical protein GCM10011611_60710 [Aliidongia dinghuensis]|uniref:Uncharacterized protein n=1 Tax=Aliidongia dinghuensis TaxID=1867774 RepID=A0A8J3E6M5_9PROT|nr:hypothetical protein GCM10011611_60710 [Aliidongia dinghuensis]